MSEQVERPEPEAVSEGGPRGDIVAGIAILLIALLGWWTVRINPELVGTDYGSDPGPGMVPQLTLTLLVLAALALIAHGIVALRGSRSRAGTAGGSGGWSWLPVPAAMVISLVLYALAFPWVGFVETTLAFTILWSIVLGALEFRPNTVRPFILYIAEAGLITFLVWLAFAKLIGVPLP